MSSTHILKVSRLEGLTDGIFAFAMTVLVLDLHIPHQITSLTFHDYLLTDIPEKLIVYVGSFVILSTQWIAMNFQTGMLERLNRVYLWTHVLYLMMICTVPFSASLVGTYPHNYSSIVFFALNLLICTLTQFLTLTCAYKYKLNNISFTDQVRHAAVKRIFVAPIFYIASMAIAYWHQKIAFALLVAPIIVYMIPGRIDKFNK